MTTTVMVYKNPNLGLIDIELIKNNEIIKRMRLTKDEWEQLKKIVHGEGKIPQGLIPPVRHGNMTIEEVPL